MRITTVAHASTNSESPAHSAGPPAAGDEAAVSDKDAGTLGVASAPASPAAGPPKTKPKRPLSGYNLFYRYKRNLVVEVTSRPNHDNEAIIRSVLATPPGLEGVPPASPLLCLPVARLNEFRVAAIRNAMQGKLFANENAQTRVHCKVHGIGFVEMGKMMRQTWGQADKLTKEVFNELADVGRLRYKRLVAEYKLSSEHPYNAHSKTATAEDPIKSTVADKTSQGPISRNSGEAKPATRFTATPESKKNEGFRRSYARKVSKELDVQGTVPSHARSYGQPDPTP